MTAWMLFRGMPERAIWEMSAAMPILAVILLMLGWLGAVPRRGHRERDDKHRQHWQLDERLRRLTFWASAVSIVPSSREDALLVLRRLAVQATTRHPCFSALSMQLPARSVFQPARLLRALVNPVPLGYRRPGRQGAGRVRSPFDRSCP
jgi:hypothetical protein